MSDAELDNKIALIDSLLNSENDDIAGYQAFVHLRKIWPQLKALRTASQRGSRESVIEECANLAARFYDIEFPGRADAIDVGRLVCKQVADAILVLSTPSRKEEAPGTRGKIKDRPKRVMTIEDDLPASVAPEPVAFVCPKCGSRGTTDGQCSTLIAHPSAPMTGSGETVRGDFHDGERG